MAKQSTIENLKKAIEVLESNHVASVEVGFEYEADGVRYYTAITRKGMEQHRYTVRVYFDSDGDRFIKCNCAASDSHICRHILKVAQVDSDTFGIEIYLPNVASYKAHRLYLKAAA